MNPSKEKFEQLVIQANKIGSMGLVIVPHRSDPDMISVLVGTHLVSADTLYGCLIAVEYLLYGYKVAKDGTGRYSEGYSRGYNDALAVIAFGDE